MAIITSLRLIESVVLGEGPVANVPYTTVELKKSLEAAGFKISQEDNGRAFGTPAFDVLLGKKGTAAKIKSAKAKLLEFLKKTYNFDPTKGEEGSIVVDGVRFLLLGVKQSGDEGELDVMRIQPRKISV